MGKDYLERFIEAHQSEWDDQKAPPQLWDKIASDLPVSKKANNPWKIFSLIMSLIVIALLIAYLMKGSNNEIAPAQEVQLEFAELEDFKETEHFYLSSIQVNYEKLNRHGIDATLEEDLSLLDNNYKELHRLYKSHLTTCL